MTLTKKNNYIPNINTQNDLKLKSMFQSSWQASHVAVLLHQIVKFLQALFHELGEVAFALAFALAFAIATFALVLPQSVDKILTCNSNQKSAETA